MYERFYMLYFIYSNIWKGTDVDVLRLLNVSSVKRDAIGLVEYSFSFYLHILLLIT